jgi:hypothetical protein
VLGIAFCPSDLALFIEMGLVAEAHADGGTLLVSAGLLCLVWLIARAGGIIS